jgi:hypothetical protein
VSDETNWKRARLIPVAGIKGAREAEQRATSALLAVLSIVRDFSHELLTPLGASSAAKATVETFTEVTMDSSGDSVRPDGVIRVTFGKRSFTALVEVKTGDNQLDRDQINAYWKSARQAGYDHVITISNQIAASGAHPVDGLRVQKNSPVQISHLSWVRILAAALRLKNHTGVEDPEQAWILGELVRYLQHDASGVLPLADMGGAWSSIRDSARAGTLNRRTPGLKDVARKIDEMHTFAAVMLSTQIGEDVDVMQSKAVREQSARVDSFMKAMIDGESVGGRLRIPNTAGDVTTEIDLRAQQLTASVDVRAPADKGARGRIGWIVGQLSGADGEVVVEAYAKNARVPVSASLSAIREDRSVLLGDRKAEPNRFVIKRRVAMPHGRRSTARKAGFVDGYMALLAEFYEGVVQDLTPWHPPAPKRKPPVEAQPAEASVDDWVWSPTE